RRIDHGGVDGGARRHGQHLGRGGGRGAALFRTRDPALDRVAAAGSALRPAAYRAGSHPHADLRPRAGPRHAFPAGGTAALGGEKARARRERRGAARRRAAMSVLLEAKAVSKRFGGVQALAEVSFAIEAAQIYGLIGPNGAGKTTLFNLLTGIYAPDAGAFAFAGRDISGLRPDRVAAA